MPLFRLYCIFRFLLDIGGWLGPVLDPRDVLNKSSRCNNSCCTKGGASANHFLLSLCINRKKRIRRIHRSWLIGRARERNRRLFNLFFFDPAVRLIAFLRVSIRLLFFTSQHTYRKNESWCSRLFLSIRAPAITSRDSAAVFLFQGNRQHYILHLLLGSSSIWSLPDGNQINESQIQYIKTKTTSVYSTKKSI